MQDDSDALLEANGFLVKSLGVRWFHPGGFVIDRPEGHRDYSFVQWLSPSILQFDGVQQNQPAGGCIIYEPGYPQWYGSDIFTPFGNHWFHFSGAAVPGLLSRSNIPLNRPILLRNDGFIEPALRNLLNETMSERQDRNYAVSAHAMLFFIEFGRALLREARTSQSARNMELREKFEQFRERLRANCTEHWSLNDMATELHLSTSRFSNLYREFFDAKPIDDLIRMRIELAEYYLGTSVMPVNYIANLCGFTDIYYFSRVFKAKTGKTATSFRSQLQEA